MEMASAQLTVFFEDPFWVGIYERESGGRYEACRIVFGPEPKDWTVYEFLLKNWHKLRFSPSMAATGLGKQAANPKRQQRQIQKSLQRMGTGTRSQQALKLQREQGKALRQHCDRTRREQDQARRFALRQEKRREKHKGH